MCPIPERLCFGEVLRGHRHAARMTLEQLAEASGVSARAISDMERGRSRGPQHRTVTALADALALTGAPRERFAGLARDGRLRSHWADPSGRCELPGSVADFTGRAAELVWVSQLVHEKSAPGVGVVGMVTGSAGVGKTTFAIRAAHALRPSHPDGVLFLDLLGMSRHPLPVGDALRQLLGALGVPEQRLPGDVPGRAALYRSVLRDERVLVVLDNAATEEQVRPLLPWGAAGSVLVTGRRPLAGLEGVRRLILGPLAPRESVEMLTRILGTQRASGGADGERARLRLAELCGGLPLALRIIGNRLVSRPGWDAADLVARLEREERRLDQLQAGDLKISNAFALSYEQLTPSSRRMFRRLAAVPGPDFDAALAAVAGGVAVEEAWDALASLVGLGLLHDTTAGRFRFHDLVRLFARERLREEESAAGREALMGRLTAWLPPAPQHPGRRPEGHQGRPAADPGVASDHADPRTAPASDCGCSGAAQHSTAASSTPRPGLGPRPTTQGAVAGLLPRAVPHGAIPRVRVDTRAPGRPASSVPPVLEQSWHPSGTSCSCTAASRTDRAGRGFTTT
ncbi:helix-turn-helix domain-containing protein [Streptomyces vinaceus]|uniref:helix-turn-helix domain-containing protein n=1 Tax=Streptomyces vinaceus TaxID=1960 RepID=UPI0035DA5EF7